MNRLREAWLAREERAGRWVEISTPLAADDVVARITALVEEGNVETPIELPSQRVSGHVVGWVRGDLFQIGASGMFNYRYKPRWACRLVPNAGDEAGSRIVARAVQGGPVRAAMTLELVGLAVLLTVMLSHARSVATVIIPLAVAALFLWFVSIVVAANRTAANPERDALLRILLRAVDGTVIK
jgi:hypothetical protein